MGVNVLILSTTEKPLRNILMLCSVLALPCVQFQFYSTAGFFLPACAENGHKSIFVSKISCIFLMFQRPQRSLCWCMKLTAESSLVLVYHSVYHSVSRTV